MAPRPRPPWRAFRALASDFDGTLATGGRVAPGTLEALHRLAASGRKRVLATGRLVDDLIRVFPAVVLFDRVVAENGGVLYRPASGVRVRLAGPPPRRLTETLARLGVAPLEVGTVIVATRRCNDRVVREVIRDLRLALRIEYNRDAVMVLPAGVSKGTGLLRAMAELGLDRRDVAAIGDAENDAAMLSVAGCGLAVADAAPALREVADRVSAFGPGRAVVALARAMLRADRSSAGAAVPVSRRCR